MVIIAILFSFDAFSKVSNGELRQITKQFTNEHHPECKVLFRTSGSWTQVKGDVMVCSNRLISSFDKELNKLYKVKVVKLMDFGAFCELEPGLTSLLHSSELSWTKKNVSTKGLGILAVCAQGWQQQLALYRLC